MTRDHLRSPEIALQVSEVRRAVEALQHCIAVGLKPRDIMTKHAFENAVRLVMVTGGSTNATFHPIAMARRNPFLINDDWLWTRRPSTSSRWRVLPASTSRCTTSE